MLLLLRLRGGVCQVRRTLSVSQTQIILTVRQVKQCADLPWELSILLISSPHPGIYTRAFRGEYEQKAHRIFLVV